MPPFLPMATNGLGAPHLRDVVFAFMGRALVFQTPTYPRVNWRRVVVHHSPMTPLAREFGGWFKHYLFVARFA